MLSPVLLATAVGLLGLQRIGELVHARRTAARLEAQGARLVRRDGYGLLVAVHALFFAACLAEGLLAPWPGVGWWSAVGLAAFLAGQFLRYGSMAALGWRWNTRVYVLPEAPLVATGPYRFLRHPIYLGVALELAGFPLLFGLWGTLLGIGLLHLPALLRRIRLEEGALGLRGRTG
ncbi:MAG TPA: isoprenylcysteine carboxylmethyltransferase family protein [Candidatus Thermoplasmatota archaeon]|nr:isoprenylcysteine carboxylmethyltransferase family protein [Candidatus Thermoplasmatota archaeon]